jgi:G3E family GTPase
MDTRIPVTIVSGFLGSGKTTLLRQALSHPSMKGAVLLINEVAELGVDDRLLRGGSSPVVLMENGCLCCTASEDLRRELRGILELGGPEPHKQIIIEMSGLADPLSAIATITTDPYLVNHLRIDFVLTLVDCMHIDASEAASADYHRQIEAADVVLLSKADLATEEQVRAARDLVMHAYPVVPCFLSSETSLPELAEIGSSLRADRLARRWIEERAETNIDTHPVSLHVSTSPEHHHELHPHTFCIRLSDELDWTRLSIWLSLILHRHGERILRIKGFVALGSGSAPVLINCIHHLAYFPEHLDKWPDGDRSSFLVFIVREISPEIILRSFLACVQPVAQSSSVAGHIAC